MKIQVLLAFISLFLNILLNATDQQILVYCISGINGYGSETTYVQNLLGDSSLPCIAVPTPAQLPDLGQARCQSYLHNALKQAKVTDSLIIHATSQGTATALNYFLQVDKGKRIKALILEAPLVSGNSAILHTIKGPLMNMPGLVNLPLSYYWLPYCSKVSFPLYWPAGKQPIKAVHATSDALDIPIILIHSKDDPQLSHADTCALYYGLSQKNKNVYLMSKEGRKHLHIIKDPHEQEGVRAILSHHDLLGTTPTLNLVDFKPDPENFKRHYEELLTKERKHLYVGYGLLVAGSLLLAKASYTLYKKLARV